jgi:formylglycine-generating enzyme required for sulfatase activity
MSTPPTGGSSRATEPAPSRSPEDLTQDRLLLTHTRDERGRPTLGRIPLHCRIGKGGMGSVYYAIHPRLHVEVAVKVLPHHLLEEDPALADRFVSEARLAASLSSENIVRVLDVDQDQGTYFIVMEYVHGESAGALLRRRRAEGTPGLPEAEALDIVTAATRGLAAAHARGIIHRDIKPDNILLPGGDGRKAKLADLGLAKPMGAGQSLGTASHMTMGTPGYMAPEQANDARSAGPPADVFATGATLYALLSGQEPFPGPSVNAILRDTELKEPKPLPSTVSAKTRELVAVCMTKDPAGRFADAKALLSALEGDIARARKAVSTAKTVKLGVGALSRGKMTWVLAAVALLAAGVLAWTLIPPGIEPKSAAQVEYERLVEQATLEMAAGRLKEALALAEQALKVKPTGERGSRLKAQVEEDLAHPPSLEVTIAPGVTLKLLRIRPGLSPMGDEGREPKEWIRVVRRRHYAWIGETEVTQGQWEALMSSNPSRRKSPDRPVETVSWFDALAFLRALNAKLPAGYRAGLPTEAEWESAARSGKPEPWPCGPDPASLVIHGVFGVAGGAQPVGSKQPNVAGFRDMLGNVGEWCQDWQGPPGEPVDTAGPERGIARVIRGGGWRDSELVCRHGARGSLPPETKDDAIGFRIAVREAPGRITVPLAGGVAMEFLLVPAEGAVSRDFWMSETEVTQAQWRALLGPPPSREKGDELPVDDASGEDAAEFAARLNAGLKDRSASLPTEAEWELAARTDTAGWFKGESAGRPQRVKTKAANAFGLHDLLGNVAEWCRGGTEGDQQALRGGSVLEEAPSRREGRRGERPGMAGVRVILR